MTVWIRADASPAVGMGHVMRMLALAEACGERGIAAHFVSGPDLGVRLLQRHGHAAVDPDDGWLDRVSSGDAIVLDGYDLDVERERARTTGAVVAVIDDEGVAEVEADLVVNPNDEDVVYRSAGAVLAGPRYALVRRAFHDRRRLRGGDGTLLVTLGGGDAGGLAGPVLDAVAAAYAAEVVVVGPAMRDVEAAVGRRVVRDPDDVAEVFDLADAAVCAAGSTTWELLCMGVPLTVVPVVANQERIAARASAGGAAIAVEAGDAMGARMRAAIERMARPDVGPSMSRAALELVDGRGPARIIDALGRLLLT